MMKNYLVAWCHDPIFQLLWFTIPFGCMLIVPFLTKYLVFFINLVHQQVCCHLWSVSWSVHVECQIMMFDSSLRICLLSGFEQYVAYLHWHINFWAGLSIYSPQTSFLFHVYQSPRMQRKKGQFTSSKSVLEEPRSSSADWNGSSVQEEQETSWAPRFWFFGLC